MDVAIYSRAFILCLSKHIKMNVPVNIKKNIAATVVINTQPKVHGKGLVSIILAVVINMKPGCVSKPLTPGRAGGLSDSGGGRRRRRSCAESGVKTTGELVDLPLDISEQEVKLK